MGSEGPFLAMSEVFAAGFIAGVVVSAAVAMALTLYVDWRINRDAPRASVHSSNSFPGPYADRS